MLKLVSQCSVMDLRATTAMQTNSMKLVSTRIALGFALREWPLISVGLMFGAFLFAFSLLLQRTLQSTYDSACVYLLSFFIDLFAVLYNRSSKVIFGRKRR